MRHILRLIFCLMASLPAVAQLPPGAVVTPLNSYNGFPSRVIAGVVQDQQGFIWIGTADGLFRYDGYGFTPFQQTPSDTNRLQDHYITRIAMGPGNMIWMGLANGGVSSFNPQTGFFRNYTLRIKQRQLSGSVYMVLPDRHNHIWIGMEQEGLLELDVKTGITRTHSLLAPGDTTYTGHAILNTVATGVEDSDGNIWLATRNGLYKMSVNHALESFPDPLVKTGSFRNKDFIAITKLGDDVYLGSWAGGLSRFNTVTRTWKNYRINAAAPVRLTTNIVSSLIPGPPGKLWITSNDMGFGVFDVHKETVHFYTEQEARLLQLPIDLCYRLYPDRNNNLWLVHEWGLTRIQLRANPFRFTPVPVRKTDNKSYYYVRDLLETDRYRFIATTLADGLHVIDTKNGRENILPVETLPGEEPFLAIYRLFRDSKQRIWIVSRDVLYRYDTIANRLVKVKQPETDGHSAYFNNMAEDHRGNLWITTSRKGVYRYDPETEIYTAYNARNKQLTSDVYTALAVDQTGKVWVGGPKGGLAYFDPKQQQFRIYRPDKRSDRLQALYADGVGNIWAGSDEGLLKIRSTDLAVTGFFGSAEGLRGNQVYHITGDAKGNIWCVTPAAIAVIHPERAQIQLIPLQADFIKSISSKVYLARLPEGVKVLTYGGYYSVQPDFLSANTRNMPLAITSMHLRTGEKYVDADLQEKGRVYLGANENIFSFEFAVLDYDPSANHQYTYMLEGFDKTWSAPSDRRYASYTNIRGGNYIFKVKVLNSYGETISRVIAVPLHIDQPFYFTAWFITLMALVVLGSFYFIYRYRINKEREILQLQTKAQALEKEKTLVQYENLKQHLNPHFLFNSLTSLSSLIRLDQKLAGSFLDGMSKIYRYILQSKENETVLLRDELNFIQTFIHLQQTRFAQGLDIQVSVPESYWHKRIVPVTLQNLIENAIKHNIIDEESPLRILITTAGDDLVVRNNLQKKKFVDTSNKQGLDSLVSLYRYLTERPVVITETETEFMVKIPLI
ncbi:MAG: hypothetical protein GXC72_14600 [Chitinophagaceae bacterium]|nr:hypothetical protein [Chitinophagaceae bacterium]